MLCEGISSYLSIMELSPLLLNSECILCSNLLCVASVYIGRHSFCCDHVMSEPLLFGLYEAGMVMLALSWFYIQSK